MISVPFHSLKHMHDHLKTDLDRAVESVYTRGQFILGAEVDEFEKAYASYSGTKFCVGMASGLDALYASLFLVGIGEGDEVIVPAHTYIATWLAITRTGAKIVPVDVLPDTMLMNPAGIEEAITKDTKAILPVHLYGSSCNMTRIEGIAEKHKLLVAEDNAQGHGASWNNKLTGSFGQCNATSFYPTKNLGAIGDGGAITTDSEKIYQEAIRFRNYGSSERFVNPAIGINSRLDEIQAAVLRVKLLHLDEWNKGRREIADVYTHALGGIGDIILPSANDGDVFHLYVIRTQHREKLRSYLFQKGIGTMVHYPIPPHLQEAYKQLKYRKGNFPVSEGISETALSLPMWPGLASNQIQWVIEHVQGFFDANPILSSFKK